MCALFGYEFDVYEGLEEIQERGTSPRREQQGGVSRRTNS